MTPTEILGTSAHWLPQRIRYLARANWMKCMVGNMLLVDVLIYEVERGIRVDMEMWPHAYDNVVVSPKLVIDVCVKLAASLEHDEFIKSSYYSEHP